MAVKNTECPESGHDEAAVLAVTDAQQAEVERLRAWWRSCCSDGQLLRSLDVYAATSDAG